MKWLAEAGYGDLTEGPPAAADKLPISELLITYNPKMNYSTSFWPVDEQQCKELDRIIPGGFESQAVYYTYLSMPMRENAACGLARFDNDQGGHNFQFNWYLMIIYMLSVQVLCGGWGDFSLPRNPEEIVEFWRGIHGLKPVDDWVFSALDILFRSRDQAMYENIRVREYAWFCVLGIAAFFRPFL